MDTIEHHASGGTSFVGKDAVNVFRLHTLISALKLGIKGLRMSRHGSALSVAKRTTGLKTNDRAKHIERIELMLANAKAAVVYVNKDEAVQS